MGYIYLLNMEGTDFYKIGITVKNDVISRVSHLQTGNPYELVVVKVVEYTDATAVEKEIHKQLKDYHVRGEWFRGSEETIRMVFDAIYTMFLVDDAFEENKTCKLAEFRSLPIDDQILQMLRTNPNVSKNKIYDAIGGNRNAILARIDELRMTSEKGHAY